MEVRLVERDLAEVPELVRLRRLRRVVVVEPEHGALPVADLEEAHDAALVRGILADGLATLDPRDDALDDDRRLEVGRRAGLRERQVGGIAESEDVRAVADAERVA